MFHSDNIQHHLGTQTGPDWILNEKELKATFDFDIWARYHRSKHVWTNGTHIVADLRSVAD